MDKKCVRCSETKDSSEFYSKKENVSGFSSWCKKCLRDAKRERYRVNPGQGIDKVRDSNYKKYGITNDDYNRMLVEQNGGCKICGERPENRRLHVDHNHTTGKVRSLLCSRCNHMIGNCREQESILRLGIEYLKEYNK